MTLLTPTFLFTSETPLANQSCQQPHTIKKTNIGKQSDMTEV